MSEDYSIWLLLYWEMLVNRIAKRMLLSTKTVVNFSGAHHHVYDWRDDHTQNPDLFQDPRTVNIVPAEEYTFPFTAKPRNWILSHPENYNPKDLTTNMTGTPVTEIYNYPDVHIPLRRCPWLTISTTAPTSTTTNLRIWISSPNHSVISTSESKVPSGWTSWSVWCPFSISETSSSTSSGLMLTTGDIKDLLLWTTPTMLRPTIQNCTNSSRPRSSRMESMLVSSNPNGSTLWTERKSIPSGQVSTNPARLSDPGVYCFESYQIYHINKYPLSWTYNIHQMKSLKILNNHNLLHWI